MTESKLIANILIIDDESDVASVIEAGLRRNGFATNAFTDSIKAMNHFQLHSREYCAVLSDIRMPGKTGFQVAREAKKTNPDVKVILMSAFEIKEEFQKVMPSTQVDDFITKPAHFEEIKSVLLRHVGQTKQLTSSDASEM